MQWEKGLVSVSPALYAKASRKAEYDSVPLRTVMETALLP